jgi:hypothetical protein
MFAMEVMWVDNKMAGMNDQFNPRAVIIRVSGEAMSVARQHLIYTPSSCNIIIHRVYVAESWGAACQLPVV